MNISGAANAGYSADGSLASSHSHTSSSSRPASVIAYTVRSGRRPSRLTSTGSMKPRSASRATVSYTDDSLMRKARSCPRSRIRVRIS